MAPYGRAPDTHLIDSIIDRPGRRWLADCYDAIAGTTLMPGGVPDTDHPLRTVWFRRMRRPDTMNITTVRIVLDADTTTIVTALPS